MIGKFKIAFGTDDGKTFVERHFGDALFFDIYEIDDNGMKFVKRLKNTSEKEKIHSDPEKAKGVSGLLLSENVSVVAAKIFGPNLKRIKKKFVCLIFKNIQIETCSNIIFQNLNSINRELLKGKTREHLVFEQQKRGKYAEHKTV